LRANPTVKRQEKRHGLLREEEQLAWLHRKAADGGFDVRSVEIIAEGPERAWGRRHSNPLSFVAVRLEGVLCVTDAGAFLEVLQRGIGSGKGFGFGLLSLARTSV
jgi:CRISPR system Cascade subunit CasE